MLLLAAFGLGIVCGLRTFTAVAVLFWRHGVLGTVFAICALLEYGGDLLPNAPSRTSPPALVFRLAAGGFAGWTIASRFGAVPAGGALLGVLGALAGAFGVLQLRLRAIKAVGNIPAGIIEDAFAIGLAVLIVVLV